MKTIAKTIFLDNVKSKIVIIYFLMLALLSWTSLLLEDSEAKGSLTILNIVLFIIPLMSLLYATTYLYNSRDFVVLLLSQPLRRGRIWHSLYAGVAGSLLLAFLAGAGLPVALYCNAGTAAMIVLMGSVVTLVFVSVAFLTAIVSSDKTRGIGAAILLWLLFTIVWDALLMYVLMVFASWPVEKPVMALLMLNPLDQARFQVILKMDVAAMMGYSGAAFKEFLGAAAGVVVSALLLAAWIVVPYLLSLRVFRHKDL
ncbi:ABC transporter permease [Prevotella sp. kh1p2]|uniref:ABC transporter permease n=1 Tax=Prevotella sp. kh1p2 TaxID=1761883 RepID=UPI0008BB1DAC|nr:ABC transporter permease [Prevotella sp. kh1p2]SET16543.1 Cu-processing system permease protein [Prevotella sp. kh1p2]SNU12575.1 Cu-processing system permease protein [Prevotellaceae bacterium KH2P17]